MPVQNLKDAQYDVFTATRTRVSSNGLAMMPVAGPYPTPSVVVALNGGAEFDIVAYVAVRRGAPPVVPGPRSTNPNRVFLNGQQNGVFSMPDLAGVINYVTSGYYIFGILAPEGLASDFMLGTVPFPGADSNDMIPGSYLSYTMINQNIVPTVPPSNVPQLPPLLRNILGR